jgi:hypothetical protein
MPWVFMQVVPLTARDAETFAEIFAEKFSENPIKP